MHVLSLVLELEAHGLIGREHPVMTLVGELERAGVEAKQWANLARTGHEDIVARAEEARPVAVQVETIIRGTHAQMMARHRQECPFMA